MFPRINPTTTISYRKLQDLRDQMSDVRIKTLFDADPTRIHNYTIMTDDLMVDYSKHLITDEVKQTLIQLARECKLDQAMDAMVQGDTINETEVRSVLHTALRHPRNHQYVLGSQEVTVDVHRILDQMKVFCEQVISGQWRGYTGKAITTIVNIGIG